MAVRSVEELMQVADPAWPLILAAIEDSDSATVLPASAPQAEATLFALQVSVQSALGALALNAGGVLIDKGWIRILGAGAEGLPGLAAANGLSHPSTSGRLPYRILMTVLALHRRLLSMVQMVLIVRGSIVIVRPTLMGARFARPSATSHTWCTGPRSS